MPELPEVECLTRAVRKVVKGGRLVRADFLRKDLRDPIPIREFKAIMEGAVVEDVVRRSKYLLMQTKRGYGVFHLGMTGNMLWRQSPKPEIPHTHAVFTIEDKKGRAGYLHFVDPRRFGRIDCVECSDRDTLYAHEYFADLGPEPLTHADLGAYLFEKSRGKSQPIKSFLMDARIVVGVGNIYASESLFRAGINPKRKAGAVTRERFAKLAKCVVQTLEESIEAGGTTFRDFKNSDGNPGYFRVQLHVYDRSGEPCGKCGTLIKDLRQSGRTTFFCPVCQS
jgi:formamidopyrimidine-DNA glycosylase